MDPTTTQIMDLSHLRSTVRSIIEAYAKFRPSNIDVEVETIFDEARDHYELMYAGWNGVQRIHGSVLHVDIRNEKIWIQFDGTEDGIAEELVKAGIPRDRIVLAFKSPSIRKYTDYAVA